MEAKEPGSHPQDPAAERDAGRKAITIKELAERFDKEHIAIRVKASTGKEYRRNLQQFILPALGQLTVTGVTRADVAKFHHDLRHIPYQANRCLEVISKMFSLSEMWGLRPDGTNPRKHIRKYPEEKRERFLSAAELRRLRAGNVGTADGALDVSLGVGHSTATDYLKRIRLAGLTWPLTNGNIGSVRATRLEPGQGAG